MLLLFHAASGTIGTNLLILPAVQPAEHVEPAAEAVTKRDLRLQNTKETDIWYIPIKLRRINQTSVTLKNLNFKQQFVV